MSRCECCASQPRCPDPYTFHVDAARIDLNQKENFEPNFITTTNYTCLSFLPKALLLQFQRIANLYFLVVAVCLSIPEISPISPVTAWAPLIIVITISMAREGYQDYQRYKSDRELNFETQANILRSGKFQKMQWSRVVVGDICQVRRDETFPADLILVSSSSEGGLAYIETSSLDGENDLKPRAADSQTVSYSNIEELQGLKGIFYTTAPNKDLRTFNGRFEIQDKTAISYSGDKQLLYRGTRLKNTNIIYGIVIFTGRNTKILLNSECSSQKMSQVEKKVNYVLLMVLAIQLLLSITSGIAGSIFRKNNQTNMWYIAWPDYNVELDGFITFLVYFLLLNTMIPISLVVSMEIVKLFQKYFLEKDQLMYSKNRDKMVEVRSSALNEELGQIEYVFTDKTGTLTMNFMEFKIATIGNRMFGDINLLTQRGSVQMQNGFADAGLKMLLGNSQASQMVLAAPITVYNRERSDKMTFGHLHELANEYFLALSLAHEVVSDTESTGKLRYQGPSTDEIALVEAAKAMGYEFISGTQSSSTICVQGELRTFVVLQVFPFTAQRKKMSIIVRDPRDGLIKMYTKGADSFIKERLSKNSQIMLDNEVRAFALVGLRTLLIAMRLISEYQYAEYVAAKEKLQQENNDIEVQLLQARLESELYLLGATAVLDRLQDDVPETIRDLLRASISLHNQDIKVWMLTGDKLQTAESIAKSCKLIYKNYYILKYDLKQQSEQQMGKSPLDYLKELVLLAGRLVEGKVPKAFLIEGVDLTVILSSHEGRYQLAQMASQCETVICCRLLPSQKADVVNVVRQHLNKITLAIGDGANDVPMIKTAHVGIGLFGCQGMGAVQASDYALPEFRMLYRLLFVHGRWNYIRISEMILYFFYKNILFTIPQFIAGIFNGFSGQTIFDSVYVLLYNLVFTAIPLLIRAILEQDVNYVVQKLSDSKDMPISSRRLQVEKSYLPSQYGISKQFYRLLPKAYFISKENCIFNLLNFASWLLEGFIQSTLMSLFVFEIIGSQSLNQFGLSSDYHIVGLTIYSAIMMIVTIKLSTHTRFWSCLLLLCIIFLSLGLYILYMWISNYFFSIGLIGTTWMSYQTISTYLVVLFCTIVVLVLDGIIVFCDFFKAGYISKMRQTVREEQVNNAEYYSEINLTITQGLTENNL